MMSRRNRGSSRRGSNVSDHGFRLKVYIAIFAAVMAIGTVGFMATEGRTLFDSAYYTVVTVATVGYGDIHPETPAGKAIAIMIILFGTGTFLGVVATATEMMLSRREERSRHDKLNILAGLFFSEIGLSVLKTASIKDSAIGSIRKTLASAGKWTDADVSAIRTYFSGHESDLAPLPADFELLRGILKENQYLMIQLLENPVLVEHEHFTDILRAAFHFNEELRSRNDFRELPPSDLEHLKGDLKRLYDFLIPQWVDYMVFLKENYPYLFSLAVRTNPFCDREDARVIG